MKLSRSLRNLLLVAAAVGSMGDLWAQRADILPPLRRQETVEQAKLIVDPPAQAALEAELNSPFFPNSLKPKPEAPIMTPVPTEEGETVVQVAPPSVYELLGTIAPQINPTGSITLGGQPLLLFGQKKVKVGDQLPIIFDGERYTLIISRIESSNFTLRLGAAEVTRPIKSNSSP
ncbi:MAG: hypothetical protein SynsKO_22290 [Synoicihabitans sp.]